MIVVSITNVPPKLRGFLTKYLWEINTGVYVGKISARIREGIWRRIIDNVEDGKAIMVFPSDNEQGFDFYSADLEWQPIDFEGLKLIKRFVAGNGRAGEESDCSKAEKRYVVLDLETTGLDIQKDTIIEIGAIRFIDGQETERYSRIIKNVIPRNITELTGITQNMSNLGVDTGKALNGLMEFIGSDPTIGFNIIKFDLKLLKKE